MYFTGTPSTQWNMSAVLQVQSIRATDFDVVDLTPSITSLSVSSGPLSGGTSVTINGRNFSGAAGGMHVLFGMTEAASFTIVSDSQIVAVAPTHAAGTVDVRVQSGQNETDGDGASVFFGYGTSANTAADDFTFSSSSPPVPPPPSPPPPSPPPPSPPPPSPPPPSPPPPVPPPPTRFEVPREFAVGADRGSSAAVRFFNPNGTERFTRSAFAGFTGGIRVAAADFNGDGIADVVVGTGPGGPTRVRILDGTDGHELFAVAPFEAAFTGGVYVSAGDLTGDEVSDLIVSPDEGGGPRVLVFRGGDYQLVANFFGIDDKNFRGGVRTAVGDVNGDGIGDLIISAGFGGGPRIAVYDGLTLVKTPSKLFNDFFLFEPALRNGAFVAAGDVNGDGFGDIIGGGGPGGAPRVYALSGKDLIGGNSTVLANFYSGNTTSRGGVRVAAKNLDGDAKADIVTGDGTGSGNRVSAYLGKDFAGAGAPVAFAFDTYPGFSGGVFVG